MSTKINQRNYSIDIARYACAIIVVAIHTKPFLNSNGILDFLGNKVITSIAVPFFLAIGGYYYICKLINGEKVFIKQISKLLLIYSVWSIPYLLLQIKDFLEANMSFLDITKKISYLFLVEGSYYHFWYFPALIYSICFVTFLHKIKSIKVLPVVSIILYLLGCLSLSYYEVGIKIPILNAYYNLENYNAIRRIISTGIPFFSLGYFILNTSEQNKRLRCKKTTVLLIIVLFMCEIKLVEYIGIAKSVNITLLLYPLTYLMVLLLIVFDPFNKYITISKICRYASNITYYIHPLFIVVYTKIFSLLHFEKNTILLFVLTGLSTFIGSLIVYKLNNKLLNKISI